MIRKMGVFCILGIFVVSLAGCATGRKKKDLEIQGLKNQVSVLESQVQSKDEELNSLRSDLAREKEAAMSDTGRGAMLETKSHPSTKQIQTALINAGYLSAPVHGKMGKKTREAIKAFQKANNLPIDGKVGKKTWNLLKDYLTQKVK